MTFSFNIFQYFFLFLGNSYRSGSATGECGLLPQHFYHRINVSVVTLLTLQYLLPTDFVLVGLKNNNIFIGQLYSSQL